MTEAAPSPKSCDRRTRRSQETRAALLRAALGLFAERGYHATTMDHIAEAADVARQTVFNHFRRKEDFITAWLAERHARLARLAEDEVLRGKRADEQLACYFQLLAEINEQQAGVAKALFGEIRVNDNVWQTLAPVFAAFTSTIERGQSLGEFNADIRPDLAAESVMDAYNGALRRWVQQKDDSYSLKNALRAKLEVLLTGLCPQPKKEV